MWLLNSLTRYFREKRTVNRETLLKNIVEALQEVHSNALVLKSSRTKREKHETVSVERAPKSQLVSELFSFYSRLVVASVPLFWQRFLLFACIDCLFPELVTFVVLRSSNGVPLAF